MAVVIYTEGLPAFDAKDFIITGNFSISDWPSGYPAPAIFGYSDTITVQAIALQIGASSYG